VTTNPMPLKAALEMTGAIPSGTVRLPMVALDAAQREVVRSALEAVGLTVTAG
jgi:4-hydroxy-tetrahydrodipicolinate synthase